MFFFCCIYQHVVVLILHGYCTQNGHDRMESYILSRSFLDIHVFVGGVVLVDVSTSRFC